jgi:hypothetical protein
MQHYCGDEDVHYLYEKIRKEVQPAIEVVFAIDTVNAVKLAL